MTKNFSYTFAEDEITIKFTSPAAVTYVGTLSQDQKTITFKSITGSGQIYDLINGLGFTSFEEAALVEHIIANMNTPPEILLLVGQVGC